MPNPKKSREKYGKCPPSKGGWGVKSNHRKKIPSTLHNDRELFRNKYRTTSHRLTGFDYASDGAYFITIVTKNRDHFFGEIVDNKMVLNELGKIARDEWFKTPEIRPDMNLTMVEFVVMPNHIHGVIYIGENKYNTINKNAVDDRRRDAMHGVSTTMHGVSQMHDISQMHGLIDLNDDNYKNKFAPQRKNLSSIIRGYKSAVTKNSRPRHSSGQANRPRFCLATKLPRPHYPKR